MSNGFHVVGSTGEQAMTRRFVGVPYMPGVVGKGAATMNIGVDS